MNTTYSPSEFVDQPHGIEELQHNQALASAMSATCPLCNGESRVLAHHKQATRQEPCQFLCVQGWCVPCQMSFNVDHAQLALV